MKRRGRHGVTLFLAVSVSVVSACVSVLLMADDYQSARFNLETHDREYQGWQACRQMNPTYYNDNTEAVSACLKSLEAAREDFWLKRSTAQLAGLFIIVGLGSGAGGYMITWGFVYLISVGFHRFVRWLSLRSPAKARGPMDGPAHIPPDISTEY